MKKLIPIITIALIFVMSGCAIMKKQNSVSDQLENLVLNIPADKVFAVAVKYVGATSTGKYQAASKWVIQTKHRYQSEVKWKERERYLIKVTSQGKNKSLLRIQRQWYSDYVGGTWQKTPFLVRDTAYEHNLIKSEFPAVAADIERKSIMASKK